MLSCWHETPKSRPLFDKLQQIIANLMDTSVSKHYILLNEPYQKMNRLHLDQITYLKMLTSPDDQSQTTSNIQYSSIEQISTA